MNFILRFQTRIGLSQMVIDRPFGQRNPIVTSGTKTITESRQEAADSDPVRRRFETIPKARPE